MLGGTSVGAAVLAGFAILLSPEQIDQAMHDVFVSGRGFKRIPRYSLLDHKAFDRALQR
jgi:NTE family protein